MLHPSGRIHQSETGVYVHTPVSNCLNFEAA